MIIATPLLQDCLTTLKNSRDDLCIVSFSVDQANVLEWINAQPGFPHFYWDDPSSNYECAAVGVALEFRGHAALEKCSSVLDKHSQSASLKFFGGRSFAPYACDAKLWSDFPDEYFFLPEILLEKKHTKCTLTIAVDRTRNATSSAATLLEESLTKIVPSKRLPSLFPSYQREDMQKERETWNSLVKRALSVISDERLAKVVLARDCTLFSPKAVNPYSLLQEMRKRTKTGTSFAFRPSQNSTFLGVSPECLFRVHGSFIEADSLGGTTATGCSAEENQILREEMLADSKLLHEHKLVTEDLRTKFLRVADSVVLDGKPGVLQLSSVQHLYSRLSGTLRKSTRLEEILALFHPTPAVCGDPREEALQFIESEENFVRGWYAAPIGIVSKYYTEFRVGIRSLLQRDTKLHLFTGAGIVAGSDAESEYEELERKTVPFFSVLLKE
jgi:menaquinone-specific isochorismate synthase